MTLGNKRIMANNLQALMDKHGVDRNKLCDDLNLKYMTVSDWINAKTYPRIDKIEMLANYFGVLKSDLVEARPTINLTDTITQTAAVMRKLTAERRNNVYNYANAQLDEQTHIVEEITPIYTHAKLSAGGGYTYTDNETDTYYTDRNDLKPYDIATVVYGDSMSPDYPDGDIVLIRSGYDNISGAVYAVDYDGESYLKRVYFEGDQIRLVSINDKYQDRVIALPIADDVYLNIIGKVVDSFTPVTL